MQESAELARKFIKSAEQCERALSLFGISARTFDVESSIRLAERTLTDGREGF